LALAAAVADTFAGGVAVVWLAAVADPDLVDTTIAQALGIVSPERGSVTDDLAVALADRPTLLVLDNLEHLLEATPLVAELLTRCPQLTMLVTSRASLNLRPEQVYPV